MNYYYSRIFSAPLQICILLFCFHSEMRQRDMKGMKITGKREKE